MEEFYIDQDPTAPFLTEKERTACCDIMRKTNLIPAPLSDQEISTVIAWLSWAKKEWPNMMTYYYKDCCFQKENGMWDLSYRNKDLMFSELLYRRISQ